MTTTIQNDDPGQYLRGKVQLVVALAVALVLSGCASGGPNGVTRDPWEKFNRGVTNFNDVADAVVLKPVATAYVAVTPPLIRTGVSNFMGNLGDLWSAINSALQLKPQNALENFFRFGVNSTIGLLGVLDVAGEMNLERHREDFGQTLGYYGVGTGPYLVLPLLGPSTLRDAASTFTLDRRGNVISYVEPDGVRNSLYVLKAVDTRANVLRASSVLDEAALDKYTFTRDVYLQYRRASIYEAGTPEVASERFDLPAAGGTAAPSSSAPKPK
jgi:phospholipid-binding lipoprotein MlaA